MRILLIIFAFLVISLIPVFGQEFSDAPLTVKLTVTTDKTSYFEGETIKISGNVSPFIEYFQKVTIVILGPDRNIVTIAVPVSGPDGNFSQTMKAGGAMISGDYKIRAQYIDQKITTTFVFTDNSSTTPLVPTPIPEPISNSISVTTNKASYFEGDKIIIRGDVGDNPSGGLVSIVVKAPNGNMVSIAHIDIGAKKKFHAGTYAGSFGGPSMKVEGEYTVSVNYKHATTSFYYGGSTTSFYYGGSASTTPQIQANNSPCGAGTHYDARTNSCKLDKLSDNNNREDKLLKAYVQLISENKELKNEINTLQEKLDNLQNVIGEQIKVIMDMLIKIKNG